MEFDFKKDACRRFINSDLYTRSLILGVVPVVFDITYESNLQKYSNIYRIVWKINNLDVDIEFDYQLENEFGLEIVEMDVDLKYFTSRYDSSLINCKVNIISNKYDTEYSFYDLSNDSYNCNLQVNVSPDISHRMMVGNYMLLETCTSYYKHNLKLNDTYFSSDSPYNICCDNFKLEHFIYCMKNVTDKPVTFLMSSLSEDKLINAFKECFKRNIVNKQVQIIYIKSSSNLANDENSLRMILSCVYEFYYNGKMYKSEEIL